MTDKIVVLVTCGSISEARRIAKAVVRARLAACVNISAATVESVYRWKGKVEKTREYLLFMKSTRKRFGALRHEIERMHGYNVPEIIALPVVEGLAPYLRWVEESVRPPAQLRSRARD